MFPGTSLLGIINGLSGFAATIRLQVTFERERGRKRVSEQAYSKGKALKWALWVVCTACWQPMGAGGGAFGADKGRNRQ